MYNFNRTAWFQHNYNIKFEIERKTYFEEQEQQKNLKEKIEKEKQKFEMEGDEGKWRQLKLEALDEGDWSLDVELGTQLGFGIGTHENVFLCVSLSLVTKSILYFTLYIFFYETMWKVPKTKGKY